MKVPPLLSGLVPFTFASNYTNGGGLTVESGSASYRGLINGTAPQVRQFLGIPYAKPPVDDLRWLPPQKPNSNTSRIYDATRFGASCPQYATPNPTFYNQGVPQWLIDGPTSEDCLTLSVWAPLQGQSLPVIVFATGGGFLTGGVDIQYQLPHHWVQRTQSHIAVTINYRLNIFGFPNAAGLEEQNLGIMDQRAALEWVRDNIEAFGGDPSRITFWGQSAGGASMDYHKFAYYEDPIVTGYYGASGTAFLGLLAPAEPHSNFTYVARHVGCNNTKDGAAELECMRKVPEKTISEVVGKGADNYLLGFFPVPDNKLIFANYTERYATGKIAKQPSIISTDLDEGVVVVPFNESGIDTKMADTIATHLFFCPESQTTQLRNAAGLTTYRFQYAGNFSNVSPLPWMGAYHDSELAMFFGTHRDFRGKSTQAEFDLSWKMQDMLLEFMKDPNEGALKAGWLESSGGEMLTFGGKGEMVQKVSIADVDKDCSSQASLAEMFGKS